MLDTSAVLDVVTASTVYGQAFVAAANQRGVVLLLPGSVLAQTWALAPDDAGPLIELLLDLPVVVVEPLDAATARPAGHAVWHLPDAADLTVASQVVQAARSRGWRVLTRDPGPLQRIDPRLVVETPPPT